MFLIYWQINLYEKKGQSIFFLMFYYPVQLPFFMVDIIIKKRYRSFSQKGYFNFLIYMKVNQNKTQRYG